MMNNKKWFDLISTSVVFVTYTLFCVGITAPIACGLCYVVAPEWFSNTWLGILISIVCISILLAISKVSRRHLIPASLPPIIRAFFFWVTVYGWSLLRNDFPSLGIFLIFLFIFLYMSQLMVDRIEFLSGGYILLLGKVCLRILTEYKRRNVQKISVPKDVPIVIIDTSGWYDFSESQMKDIGERFPNHVLVDSLWKLRADDYPKIDIIFGAPPKSLLKMMSSLSWIHIPSSGMNGYDDSSLYSSAPRITSSTGVYGVPIAEYTLALMLTMSKRIYTASLNNKCGYGNDVRHSLGDFQGATVLLLGLGDIGKNIATRCASLGANVIGVKRNTSEPVSCVSVLYSIDNFDEVLYLADFVVLCLPATPETDHIINASRLKQMKSTAILINVGRGNAVNQSDLKDSLRRNEIGAAALDVTTPDPLLPFSSLFKYRDLLCTLHHSSISKTNTQRAVDIFLRCADE